MGNLGGVVKGLLWASHKAFPTQRTVLLIANTDLKGWYVHIMTDFGRKKWYWGDSP